MKFKLIDVYARKELTHELPSANPKEVLLYDVQVYKDAEAKTPFGRFMWYSSNKPTRRNKYVTLNCYKWKLNWI
jgi:hypothetical protein